MRTHQSTSLHVNDGDLGPFPVTATRTADRATPLFHVRVDDENLVIFGSAKRICDFADALRAAVCEAECEIEAGARPVNRTTFTTEQVQLPSVYRSDRETASAGVERAT